MRKALALSFEGKMYEMAAELGSGHARDSARQEQVGRVDHSF